MQPCEASTSSCHALAPAAGEPCSSSHAAEADAPCSPSHAPEADAPCAPEPPAARLLQLPSELLQLLWKKLEEMDDEGVYRDQLCLRCTCRQARRATAPFIKALEVEVQQFDSEEDDEATCEEMLEESLSKLAAFPSDAVMTSLRWECWKEDSGHLLLPALLPTLLISAGNKLAAVEELSLSGVVVLGCGELSSVAVACPRIRHLLLTTIPVVGPAFWPLARLESLRVLSLKNLKLPLGVTGVCASLACLTQVTELKLVDHDADPSVPDALRLEDALPQLRGLCALRKLKLALGRRGVDDVQVLQQLSRLTQLTLLYCQMSLDQAWAHSILDLNRPHGLSPDCRPLSAVHIASMGLADHLLSLALPGSSLDTDAIRLVAAMKQLTDLEVDALLPDEDLSGIACHWKRLKLAGCQPPQKLLLVPLSGVKEIMTRGVECVRWELNPEEDTAATAAMLAAVSELLAPLWKGNEAGSRYLHLQWRAPPAAPYPHVLPALAAWNAHPAPDPGAGAGAGAMTSLFLGKHWDVTEHHVRQLCEHLPNLQSLAVSAAGSGFLRFSAALAVSMPQLQRLSIIDTSDLTAPTRDALLALAAVRASKGLPLTMYSYGCMTSSQRVACNLIAQAHAQGIEQTQVRFEIW